jgi:hypothetical protein
VSAFQADLVRSVRREPDLLTDRSKLSASFPYSRHRFSKFFVCDVQVPLRLLKLIPITGTESAKILGGKMFYLGRSNDPATLSDLFSAIVYFGSASDTKVYPDKH